MMKNKLVIVGAGGHGKVVADAAFKQNRYKLIGFADDGWPVGTVLNDGLPVLGKIHDVETMAKHADFFIIAIGNNKLRENLYKKYLKVLKPAVVIHPSAVISMNTNIGDGCVILANAVIGVDSVIGINSIVNSMALIDYDCVIGAHAQIAHGTIVGRYSEIKSYRTTFPGECIPPHSK